MSQENLIRQYVRESLKEEYTFGSEPKDEKKKKKKGFLQKVMSLLTGSADAESVSDAWIESAEEEYDVDIPDDMRNKIEKFVKEKYPSILARTKGNKEKAAKYITGALSKTYGRTLKSAQEENEDKIARELMSDEEYSKYKKQREKQRRWRDDFDL